MQLPISVFIVTLNEENNLRRLLPSLSSFSEIIIVDSGSSDDTCEVAKSFGAKVINNKWPGYAKQKQFAMTLCTNDWVMNLDADEYIPSTLISKIQKVIQSDKYCSARLNRTDYFLDKPMPNWCSLFSNTRLYKKSEAEFDESFLVHESASVKGKQAFIKEPFIHHGYNNINTLSAKLNTYSSLKAQEKFQKGKTYNPIKLLLAFPIEFLRKLVFQRFILFGIRGLILSSLYAHYSFQKEAKLYSLHKTQKPN